MKKILLPDITQALNTELKDLGWFFGGETVSRCFYLAAEKAGFKDILFRAVMTSKTSSDSKTQRFRVSFLGSGFSSEPIAVYFDRDKKELTAYALTDEVTCFQDIIDAIHETTKMKDLLAKQEADKIIKELKKKYKVSLNDAFEIGDLLRAHGDSRVYAELLERSGK